jgi:hypothetical protein
MTIPCAEPDEPAELDNLLLISSPWTTSPIKAIPFALTLAAVETEDALTLLPPSGRVKVEDDDDDLLPIPIPTVIDMGRDLGNPSSPPGPIIIVVVVPVG